MRRDTADDVAPSAPGFASRPRASRPREAPRTFATADVTGDDRLDRWEEHNTKNLIGLRCRALTGASLDAAESNLTLSSVSLARVRSTAHVVERDADLVRRVPTDSIALCFGIAGEAFFYDADTAYSPRPDQLLIFDADRPFMRGFVGGLEELVVLVPRRLVAADAPDRFRRPMLVDYSEGRHPLARALADQVNAAMPARGLGDVDETAMMDLVRAVAGHPERAPSTHVRVVEAHLNRCYTDPGLSATTVAAAVGMSTRHLSRVLADIGTSLPRLVLERRLTAAHAILTGTAGENLSVAEVARRCGFASPKHFSHAFAARFGMRASDIRRDAIASRALEGSASGA